MPVTPKRNNGQDQSLTVLLRNIISEYPAGGGVLRELCQNADDAGADTIEFVLDTRQHHTSNLLHEDLAEFQGISLLVYNNKPFIEKDFESIKRIGDSGKAKDLTSTGKFGRGFNSVYNWTDNPSILSGTSLLLLDPHKKWSSKINFPGGPLYDFVADSNDSGMKNQLSAFDSILKTYDTAFDGTIIRLPLRNEAQAIRSEIVEDNMHTSQEDIEDVFELFSNELMESLLFLRNLRSITLRIDDTIFAKAESTVPNETRNDRGENLINEGYRQVFVEQSKEHFGSDFTMEISILRSPGPGKDPSETKVEYAISHYLRKSAGNEDLQKWARNHKLFPWVAIANPLDKTPGFGGRLFTTLPLPIQTKHPAHIHGIFSITPDRSNIHSGGDTTMSSNSATRLGAQWNEWLLHECVPHAWVRNLEFMRNENLSPGWDFWPAGKQGESGQLWMGILGTVFKKVVEDGLELLPTVSGIVKPAKEVVFTLGIPEDLHFSLRDAEARVVLPPEDRRTEIGSLDHTIGLEYLSPSAGRRHLTTIKDSDALLNLDIKPRMVLLDYVLSDRQAKDFKNCEAPLIPLLDGTFRGLEMPSSQDNRVLLARDTIEEKLFCKSLKKTVKRDALSERSRETLVTHIAEIEQYTRIKAWTVEDAIQYCFSYEFSGIAEQTPVVKIDKPGFADFVELFWKWVSMALHRQTGGPIFARALKDLWLIPLGGGMFQRIGSTSEYPVLNVSVNKGIGSFLKRTKSNLANRFGPVVMHLCTGDGFPQATQILRELGIIKDYDDRESLMKWFEATMKVFAEKLDRTEKMELIRHLFDLSRDCSASERSCMESTVRKLPIFQEANDSIPSERLDPNPLAIYVGVENLPITLDTPQHIFIDIRYRELKGLVSHLELFKCPSVSEILGDHVVPRIAETGASDDKRRMGFIEFAMDQFKSLSDEVQSTLSTKEIVPVSAEKLRRPNDTVSGTYVAALYFEEEKRSPIKSFDTVYHSALVCLGMPECITDEVILERIHSYSSSRRSPHDINDKVSTLFQSKPPTQPPSKECMELCWIPAISLEGELGLFSALQCRSTTFQPLCNYSMPIMKSSISHRREKEWEEWLGWDAEFTVEQMDKQLEGAKKNGDCRSLARLVEYWYKIYPPGRSLTVDTKLELKSRKWIPGSSGQFFSPTEIFFAGAEHLHPYYDDVSKRFLQEERNVEQFLTHIGVKLEPTFEQLKELQESIATEEPLSTQDLKVALYIVEQVAERHNGKNDQNSISEFKAPDRDGVMRTFSKLTASGDDVPLFLADRLTPHPRIPESTIKKLGLPTVEDRILASLHDPGFEQDFSQKQSLMAAIRDTLQRYSVESTFSEYLANAEDCLDEKGKTATRIDWMIDHSTEYPTEKLITKELEAAQGKALFCYNNGGGFQNEVAFVQTLKQNADGYLVFTDKDFKSIIDIGIGSKGLDYSKIGKFGKGALTIIRDVETQYPDQLKPFEGVFGFSGASSRFEGTIFRFPLRGQLDKSQLCPRSISAMETRTYLEHYIEKARISLIFLKHISSISYWQKGLQEPIWTVSASSKPLRTIRSRRINEVDVTIKVFGQVQHPGALGSAENDKWWTIDGLTEEQHIPQELVQMAEYNRLQAAYGLGVPEREQPTSCFMGLPLHAKHPLSLPASINANMALQNDRRTLISEEENGSLLGSKWNNWIFEEGIVPLYLLFLRHLMEVHGTSGYRFWPAPPSEFKNSDHVPLTISTAFWKKAVESSYDLYPPIPPPLSTSPGSKPPTIKNLTIGEAIFDFLSAEWSEFIVPLLRQLDITNIVTPHPTVAKGLIEATTGKISLSLVTPAYVRDILRDPTRCQSLKDHWKNDPGNLVGNINNLLAFLLPDTSEDCLTGCSLLPLDDGSWGTFSGKSTSQIRYFISKTPLERSILEIADGRLVSQDLEGPVTDALLEKEMNVSPLTFEDIAPLCALVESKDTEYRKAWLVSVWEYFELCVTKNPTNKDQYLKSIESLPVYCGSIVGDSNSLLFLSPLDFVSGDLPAIIDPFSVLPEGCKSPLFQALNGLVLVNESTFPITELFPESVWSLAGVHRLTLAISSIPARVPKIDSLTQVFSGIPAEGIEFLSGLVLPHISDLLDGDHPTFSTLKQLPIWPVLSGSFQSATKLKLAPHTNLTLTTMIDQTTFLRPALASKYTDELEKLGVPQLPYQDFLNYEVGVARGYLQAENIGEYQRFLDIVYKENRSIFNCCNLAVNRDLCFCSPSTLYNSSEPLFRAAFRDQASSRFLCQELAESQVWRDFLIENVSGPTYIECARAIERRNSRKIPDDQIKHDSRIVFHHLCWDYREMGSWDTSIWEALLNTHFAPVQEATPSLGQSQLRSRQRERFWQQNKLVAISEAVDPRFEEISWSQKPVLRKQLGPLALTMITSIKPMITPTTVIGHLKFLASHREEITEDELPTRISEIKMAYEYLEEKIPTYSIQENALIWLNIEYEDRSGMALETFRNSWSCARNLCLNIEYDSGEIRRVCSFLGRFHNLLEHAKVHILRLRKRRIPQPPRIQSPILQGLLDLRNQGLLCDVTIISPLQTFKAHKVVLASVSNYWRGMFSSQFKESSTTEVLLQDDPNTIKVLLDYIYTNKFIKPPHEEDVTRQLENLLDQLEKSDKWLLQSFKHSMEHYLSDPYWIRPETAKSILSSSRTCNAEQLAQVCEEYIEDFREIVEMEAADEK
ncbi:unnamed protein product [Tuber aestivum]|uniref:BTB domain-containing protein n=1 Tax=Tuber aestivum TaxID=59557 RepID=A0A292Q997_9PEZI|nr:unnamed protein product [Tuber aestivum]